MIRGDAGREGYCDQCDMLVPEGPDACIGWLAGVWSACCGHGSADPFALLDDGTSLRGEDALAFFATTPTVEDDPHPQYCDACHARLGPVVQFDGERVTCAPGCAA